MLSDNTPLEPLKISTKDHPWPLGDGKEWRAEEFSSKILIAGILHQHLQAHALDVNGRSFQGH